MDLSIQRFSGEVDGNALDLKSSELGSRLV
jgi:hypothetical protein